MVPDSGRQTHLSSAKRKPVVQPSKPKPRPKQVVSSRPGPSLLIPKGSFEHVVIILKENSPGPGFRWTVHWEHLIWKMF